MRLQTIGICILFLCISTSACAPLQNVAPEKRQTFVVVAQTGITTLEFLKITMDAVFSERCESGSFGKNICLAYSLLNPAISGTLGAAKNALHNYNSSPTPLNEEVLRQANSELTYTVAKMDQLYKNPTGIGIPEVP